MHQFSRTVESKKYAYARGSSSINRPLSSEIIHDPGALSQEWGCCVLEGLT
jgi:hypothetical protein